MKLRISVAQRQAEVLRCQYFIAEIYNRRYQIMFSEEIHDLESRIEPYPQRYLMGTVNGEIVATLALYTQNTYVERYGGITPEEIRAQLEEAGVSEQYATYSTRELTKLVVADGWNHHGLAHRIHDASYAEAFMESDAEAPVLIFCCGRRKLLSHMFAPRGRVRSRIMAPFPRYAIHSRYRKEDDPMESHLTIPAVDVPDDLRRQVLPIEVELPELDAQGRT